MELNLYIVAGIVAFLFGSALAFFVGYKAWDNAPRRSFALLTQSAALWCLFPVAASADLNPEANLFLVRLIYLPGALTPPLILQFIFDVTEDQRRKLRRIVMGLAYLASACFILLAFHPKFIVGVVEHPPHFAFIPGKLFHPFAAQYILICFVSFFLLLQNLFSVEPRNRTKLQYVALALTIAIFTPLFHWSGSYLHWEPFPHDIFFITYSSIIAYAIVKHQVMEIEVLVRRTLVFAGLVASLVVMVTMVAFVSQDLLAQVVEVPKVASDVFAAAIIAGLYGPLRNWLTNVTDRFLFQRNYDYKELLKKFTDEVMLKVDLKQLVETTVNTLAETVKLEGCSLLLLDKDRRTYELVATKGVNGQQVSLGEQEQLVTFLRETHEPVWLDGKVDYPQTIKGQMTLQLKARLALPLHVHEDLIGVLLLGKKKSDEVFAKDDLDILTPLARTLAIAVTNAQLFEELAKTQAEAAQKEKLAVIGTLSAGINHEICNPLGIVKAQCEAFLLDLEDGILIGKSSQDLLERTSNIMRVALKQIDRATVITQKLSNFAKPIKDPTAQTVSIEQEIDEVLILVGHDLKLEKIDVVKEIEPGLPHIVADRRQLQEVLFNLVRNAGQAIKPPGTIWVRAKASDSLVRVEITDTGSGISEENLKKIYNPFFTTKEPGKGTGLGLFIVRQIVERNKGRIGVESVVGKGTTFSLEFPAAKAPVEVVTAH